MDIRYANNKVEKQCTDLKAATKLFGGDKNMARSLMSRINAIDVKTIRDKWRIIIQPLDDKGKIFEPCKIDEIASVVKIVEISEVSAHYE